MGFRPDKAHGLQWRSYSSTNFGELLGAFFFFFFLGDKIEMVAWKLRAGRSS